MVLQNLIYIAGKMIPGLLGFFTSSTLTHYMAPLQFGEYGLGLTIATLTSTLFFGWHGVSYARFAETHAATERHMMAFVAMFGGLMLLTAALLALCLGAGLFGQYRDLAALGIVGCWVYSWFEFKTRVEITALRPMRYLVLNLLRAAMVLVFSIAAAYFTQDPLMVLGGNFLGMLLPGFASRLPGLRLANLRGQRDFVLRVVRFGLPIAGSMTLFGLAFTSSRLLIEALSTTEAVGMFTAALLIVQNTLIVMAAAVGSAGYSMAVRALATAPPERVKRQLEQNISMLLMVMAPAAVGLTLVMPDLAHLIVGASYVTAVVALTPWMAAATFFYAIRANYLDHAFQLGHRTGQQVVVSLVATIVSVGLHVLLVPRYAEIGAGVALTVAFGIALIHGYWAGRSCYRLPIPVGECSKVLVATVLMAVAVSLAHAGSDVVTVIVKIALGGAVYVAVIVGFNVLDLRRSVISRAEALFGKATRP